MKKRYWTRFDQELLTFLSKGHISYYTTVQGQDILQNEIISEYVIHSTKSKSFRIYIIFSLLTKYLRGPDEMSSRIGFGP